ncbi:hypothetical protein HDU77_009451 [Chytriomyces hyalinus]|nr:hypothetical protein HDU77_009451 [Chytriomyces hyalinus]
MPATMIPLSIAAPNDHLSAMKRSASEALHSTDPASTVSGSLSPSLSAKNLASSTACNSSSVSVSNESCPLNILFYATQLAAPAPKFETDAATPSLNEQDRSISSQASLSAYHCDVDEKLHSGDYTWMEPKTKKVMTAAENLLALMDHTDSPYEETADERMSLDDEVVSRNGHGSADEIVPGTILQPFYEQTSCSGTPSDGPYCIPKMSSPIRNPLRPPAGPLKRIGSTTSNHSSSSTDTTGVSPAIKGKASPTPSSSSSSTAPPSSPHTMSGQGEVPPQQHPLMNADKRFECNTCQRTFSRLFNLKSHLQTHDPTRTKSYMCTVCGVGFCRQQDLMRHGTVHDKSKLMVCPVCPNKTFSRKDALRRHIRLNGCCDVNLLETM